MMIFLAFVGIVVSNIVLFNTCRTYTAQSSLPVNKRLPFSSVFILQIMRRIGAQFSDTPNPVIPQDLVHQLFRLLLEIPLKNTREMTVAFLQKFSRFTQNVLFRR